MKPDRRTIAVYLAAMAGEACVLYVLVALLDIAVDGQLAVFQILLCLPLAFIFNKLLPKLRWPGRSRVLANIWAWTPMNIPAWVIVTLLMVKAQLYGGVSFADPVWLLAVPRAFGIMLYTFAPALALLLAVAVTWGTGWRLSRIKPGFSASLSGFQFGLASLLILFFIAAMANVEVDKALFATIFFFVLSLAEMSLTRAGDSGGWLSGLRGYGPVLMVVSICLVLVLGLAISFAVSPGLLQLALDGVKWLYHLWVKLVMYLSSLIPESCSGGPIPADNATAALPKGEGFSFSIPEPWLSILRWAWNLLFFGLILLALWRISAQIFGWLRRRVATANGETEPMPGAFRADLLAMLRRLVSRVLGFVRRWRRRGGEPPEIASVREIYRRVMQRAAKYGWRRPAFQTPYEYLPTLVALLPACADDLRLITRHYVDARYGFSGPSPVELQRLKQSWRQIDRQRVSRKKKGAPENHGTPL